MTKTDSTTIIQPIKRMAFQIERQKEYRGNRKNKQPVKIIDYVTGKEIANEPQIRGAIISKPLVASDC